MSTEPNFVPEKLCHAYQARLEERLNGMDVALTEAKKDLERRLFGLNELRSEVIKDRERLVSQDIFHAQIERLNVLVSNLDRRSTIVETRSITWTTAIGIAFIILQLVIHFLK
jgi:hypothetical protein